MSEPRDKNSQRPRHEQLIRHNTPLLLGWQEWCALPQLHLPAVKAKIDTGAKTSALDAEDIRPFRRNGELFVHFIVHPLARHNEPSLSCQARVIDQRLVMNSGGHKEKRYVIQTRLVLGQSTWPIELTLTNRATLAFRMLLGREALSGRALIDVKRTLCQGKVTHSELMSFYGTL